MPLLLYRLLTVINIKDVKMKKTIRVTVDFPKELYVMLEVLEKDLNSTKADLLRKAIKLEKILFDAKKQGFEILLINPKTNKTRELIIL